MTPIEIQLLKNQSTTLLVLTEVGMGAMDTETLNSISSRMKETKELLAPKGAEDPCCKMGDGLKLSDEQFQKEIDFAKSRNSVQEDRQ